MVAALLLAACEPGVTVTNNTAFSARVIVSSHGTRQVVSPSPGGGSSFAVVNEGTYTAAAFPDSEWIAYARLVRADLNEQIKNSDKLSGEQLLDLIRRLADIAAQMDKYTAAAEGRGATCGGRVSEDSAGLVQVSQDAGGNLVISCR